MNVVEEGSDGDSVQDGNAFEANQSWTQSITVVVRTRVLIVDGSDVGLLTRWFDSVRMVGEAFPSVTQPFIYLSFGVVFSYGLVFTVLSRYKNVRIRRNLPSSQFKRYTCETSDYMNKH